MANQPAIALLPIAAAFLAACSSMSGYGGGPAQPGGSASSGPAPGMVAVQQISGLGSTLVDGSGKTLYFSDQEANGTIRCDGTCLGFWFPVPASAATGQIPGLGSVRRPDNGQQQLTYQGEPLYTFRLDNGPGQRNGDNAGDDFGGTHFTWHAATTAPAANPAPTSSGSGYGYGYGY